MKNCLGTKCILIQQSKIKCSYHHCNNWPIWFLQICNISASSRRNVWNSQADLSCYRNGSLVWPIWNAWIAYRIRAAAHPTSPCRSWKREVPILHQWGRRQEIFHWCKSKERTWHGSSRPNLSWSLLQNLTWSGQRKKSCPCQGFLTFNIL